MHDNPTSQGAVYRISVPAPKSSTPTSNAALMDPYILRFENHQFIDDIAIDLVRNIGSITMWTFPPIDSDTVNVSPVPIRKDVAPIQFMCFVSADKTSGTVY